jgi:hypothetical protein
VNRTLKNEIAAVHQRIKAAAKSEVPLTRRAAAQLQRDLAQWEDWQKPFVVSGTGEILLPSLVAPSELARLPRRIRIGLATPVKQHKKKVPAEKIITENVLNLTAHGTKQIEGALSLQILLEWLATDRHTCLRIAKALVQSPQNAEEVISKCMASAVEQIHAGAIRADNAARFHAWLHQVVRFSCYRFVKRQKMEVELTEGALQDRDIAISKRLPSADEQHYSF